MIGGLGTTELLLILAVVVLLFGASKLPELARGSGRALRIFKAETKGLVDGDDDDTKTAEEKELEARQKLLDAERDRIERERITRERRDDTTA
nr:twin-arginine translocase TatA/TatE family subunit [Nocardioides luti]